MADCVDFSREALLTSSEDGEKSGMGAGAGGGGAKERGGKANWS